MLIFLFKFWDIFLNFIPNKVEIILEPIENQAQESDKLKKLFLVTYKAL